MSPRNLTYRISAADLHDCNPASGQRHERDRKVHRGAKHKDVSRRSSEPFADHQKTIAHARHRYSPEHEEHPEGIREQTGGEQNDEQEEEEITGKESRSQSSENLIGHLAGIHHHLDTVQYPRSNKIHHSLLLVHPARALGLFLLSLLYQQYCEPDVLRPVQRGVPTNIRENPQVQVA